MVCTKCGSDNTQRLEVVYEGGLSKISTSSTTYGLTNSSILGARTETQGKSQTILSQKCSPPTKKSYGFKVLSPILFALFFSYVLYLASTDTRTLTFSDIIQVIFIILIIIASIVFSIKSINSISKYNRNEFPRLYANWQDSWLCHKCGNI